MSQMTQLQRSGTGRAFDVEQRQAEVDQLKAQVEARSGTSKRPSCARRPTATSPICVAQGRARRQPAASPVMAFIDTSETIIGVEIAQIDARYVAARPAGRADLQVRPGPGLNGQGRSRPAGDLDRAGRRHRAGGDAEEVKAAPFVVRVKLDDASSPAACRPAAPATPRSLPTRQGGAHHPQGAAAADRDHELRQSVLVRAVQMGSRPVTSRVVVRA